MNDFLASNGEPAIGPQAQAQACPAAPEARKAQDRVMEEKKGQAAGGMDQGVLLLGTRLVSGGRTYLSAGFTAVVGYKTDAYKYHA